MLRHKCLRKGAKRNLGRAQWPTLKNCTAYVQAINAVDGAKGVKNFLRHKDKQDLTPLERAIAIGEHRAPKLVSYLEELEKESRFTHPVFERCALSLG